PGEPAVAATAEELLAEADALFAEADEILANFSGLEDLARYEAKIDEAREKVDEAYAVLGEAVESPDGVTPTTAAPDEDGDEAGDGSPPTTDPPDDDP